VRPFRSWARGALSVSLMAATLLSVASLVAVAAGDDEAASSDPLGQELAIALGLEPIENNHVEGCEHLLEVSPVAYCVDAIVDDPRDAFILYMRLHGLEPSEQDLLWWDIQRQLSEIPSDAPPEEASHRQGLIEQLQELENPMSRIDQLPSS